MLIEMIKRDRSRIIGLGRRFLTFATGPSTERGVRREVWLTSAGRRSGWLELHGAGRYVGVYR